MQTNLRDGRFGYHPESLGITLDNLRFAANMPCSTLMSMAQRAAIRQVTSITDIADLPYHTVEPILRRIDNPAQLRELEKNCPHIAEYSAPLWQALIKRDVSNAESKMLYPKDPRSWWKVYRKMCKEETKSKEEAEEQLRRAMQGIKEEKKGGETRIINAVLPEKLTKGRPQYIDGVKNTGPSRIPSEKTDALKAIQRASAAARANIFKPRMQPSKVFIPPAQSQIRAAPKSMAYNEQKVSAAAARAAAEARKYAEPKSQFQRSQKVFAPQMGKKSVADRAIEEARWKAQQAREERLRALTRNGVKPRPTAAAAPSSRATTASVASTPATTVSTPATSAGTPATSQGSPPALAGRLSPRSSMASPQRRAAPSPAPSGSPAPGLKRRRGGGDPFMPVKRARP